jgi:hypothetical protein
VQFSLRFSLRFSLGFSLRFLLRFSLRFSLGFSAPQAHRRQPRFGVHKPGIMVPPLSSCGGTHPGNIWHRSGNIWHRSGNIWHRSGNIWHGDIWHRSVNILAPFREHPAPLKEPLAPPNCKRSRREGVPYIERVPYIAHRCMVLSLFPSH